MVRIAPDKPLRSGRDYQAERTRRRDFQRDGKWFYRYPGGGEAGPFDKRSEAREAGRNAKRPQSLYPVGQ